MTSRPLAFLIGSLLALPALATDNSIVIQERTGASQTNLPMTVMATIARGEIPGFARPAITILNSSGEEAGPRFVPAQWQSDAKTRWRDALATLDIESVSNPVTNVCPAVPAACFSSPYVRVTTVGPHGFRDGERVAIANSNSAEINGLWTVVDRTDTSFALAGVAKVQNPGSPGGQAVGFTNGSWATGLVTVFIPELPANGRVRIDFINDHQPSHDPANPGLTREQFAARPWNATIETATPVKAGEAASRAVSARDILTSAPDGDCGVRRWLAGPLVTEYVIEDICMAVTPPYDFGWMPVAPLKTAASASVPAIQSDGTQVISVANASDLTASDSAPLLIHYTTGGPSHLGSRYAVEYINICGINGNDLKVCTGGRGAFNTTMRDIPANVVLGAIQSKAATDPYKNFHPWFMVRAYTGPDGAPWPGVRLRYVLSNTNPYKPGTGYIAVTLKSGDGAVRWKSGVDVAAYPSDPPAEYFFHQSGTEISKVFWDKMDPEHYCDGGQAMDPCTGGNRTRKWLLDANMEYKMAAGFILPFENTKMNTGNKSPFEADFTQFSAGDRGESGIQHSKQGGAHVGYKNYRETIRGVGFSFYSAETNRSWAGASDNDREEGWVWSRAISRTLPVLGWEPRAWEILFGTSVPGGAGLQEVEHHLPMNWIEGSPVIGKLQFSYSACAGCIAFGRTVSIDVRPSLYTLKATQTSGQAAAERINYTGYGTYDANLWYNFQGPGLFFVGAQTLDTAHRQPHAPYIYLITGDFYDLRQTQNWAAWILTFKNSGTATPTTTAINAWALRRANWGIQVTPTSLIRASAWSILGLGWAIALSPNVPQSGGNQLPPERFYFESKMAKTFQAWEGMTGMVNGWFPPANPGCEGIEWSSNNKGVTTATTNDPWCWGRQDMGRNQPMPLDMTARPASTEAEIDKTTMNPALTGGGQSPFNLAQAAIALWQVKRLGLDMVSPIFERHGRMMTNMLVNSQLNNVYQAVRYQYPWISGSTSYTYDGLDGPEKILPYSLFPSWGALRNAFQPSAANPTTWDGPNRILNEIGYAHYWRAAMAAWKNTGASDTTTPGCREKEKGPAGCTGDAAYDSIATVLPNMDKYTDAKRTAQMPVDAVVVQAVTATPNSALIAYTTSVRNACRYYIGTAAPASSLQLREPSDNGKQPRRELKLAGLNQNTLYHLRLTCGRARTEFTLTTEASHNSYVISSQTGANKSGPGH